jgi:transcriptional regulator with XRE-family HTH domain
MTLLARASAAIRARRQALGLKQSEVAEAAAMSLRRYITIEHGENFTLDKLERIAIALDCPPASLLP